MQKGPGEGKSLPLAAGQIPGVFRELCVKPVIAVSAQKLIKPAFLQDFPHLIIICLRISHLQVVSHRAFKEIGAGADICDPLHNALLRAVGEMVRADHDRSVFHSIAACQKGSDGGLAAAALSYDAHKAVLRDLHVDLVEDLPLAVVREIHALEKEIPALCRKLCRFFLRLFDLEKLEDPVTSRHSVHGHMEITSQLPHGEEEIR